MKFKIGGKQFYKSRTVFKNLNPKWEEKFVLPIEDAFKPVQVKVFDYDRGVSDDPMGGSEILPTQLELNKYVTPLCAYFISLPSANEAAGR